MGSRQPPRVFQGGLTPKPPTADLFAGAQPGAAATLGEGGTTEAVSPRLTNIVLSPEEANAIDREVDRLVRLWHRHPAIVEATKYQGQQLGELAEFAFIGTTLHFLVDRHLRNRAASSAADSDARGGQS